MSLPHSPSSRLILSLTSLSPITLLTLPGLAGPANSPLTLLTGVCSPSPNLVALAEGFDGDIGGPSAGNFREPGVGDPGSSGNRRGVESFDPVNIRVGVVMPGRGLTSNADMSLLEARVVPGDAGAAATAEGISSHSFRATVLMVRKNGQSSVSMRSDVSASAAGQHTE